MLQIYIRTAMDIIGRAGFNYYFEKHLGENGENLLSSTFNAMINGMLENKKLVLIQSIFPRALDLVSGLRRRRWEMWGRKGMAHIPRAFLAPMGHRCWVTDTHPQEY